MGQFDELPPLRDVINRHGLRAKKALGQNFLLDLNLTARIARVAGSLDGYTVIEVGPGPGGLTRALLALGAKRVIAIERDQRCLPALEEIATHYPGRLEIVAADALKIDYSSLADGPAKIVANLPYNIATLLAARWLSAEPWPPFYVAMTLMFQKEVAERICAEPGSKSYGRLSVLAGWRADASIAFTLSPSAFTPPPLVTSAVVHFMARQTPLACLPERLETVTRHAFGMRRKMLRTSLKALGGAQLLARAEIDGSKRAEELDIAAFVRLANAL